MNFIDYYLDNKDEFPEMDFFEVKYSGNDEGYNSQGKMKYLEKDMVIMIPKACSQLLKEKLEIIVGLRIYSYFNDLFFNSLTESEIEKYESLFLTPDNKMLIIIREFRYDNDYNMANPEDEEEMKILLNKINSFLDISGLDAKYVSIQSFNPIYSSVWGIYKKNFNSIKEYDLELIDQVLSESIEINFKKINFKK